MHDVYPTYTICIKSLYGDIFRADDYLGIPGKAYRNSLVYNHILLGKCCKNTTITEFASNISYDEALSFDISRFVIDKVTITREGDEINSWSNETNEIDVSEDKQIEHLRYVVKQRGIQTNTNKKLALTKLNSYCTYI